MQAVYFRAAPILVLGKLTGDSSENASVPLLGITNVSPLMGNSFSFCFTLLHFAKLIHLFLQEEIFDGCSSAPSKMSCQLRPRNLFEVPCGNEVD